MSISWDSRTLYARSRGYYLNCLVVLDRSNAHQHGDFGVIQFSDTLLVYNKPEVHSLHDKQYCAMYLCEFAQQIQNMLLGRDVFLRGIVTYGQFNDTGPTPNESFSHVRAFWGKALIRAHTRQKEIKAIGLFVDRGVKPYMNIFDTHIYDEQNGIWFADTATYLRHKFFDGTDFSYAELDVLSGGTESLIAYDLFYLKRLFEHGHDESLSPSIRSKYLTTWEIYRRKYLGLCRTLEDSGFDFRSVIDIDWEPFVDRIGTPDGDFG